jgi:hypothetical protein
MPWFRFIDEARVTLPFRNGPCELTFANLEGDEPWAWVAQRHGTPGKQVVLARSGNMLGLRVALRVDGFCVSPGSAAERVMLAAVRCGYAEELPEDERWRRELLSARAALVRSSRLKREVQ